MTLAFFATADARTQAEDWFDDYQDRSFEDFGRELEETLKGIYYQNILPIPMQIH